MVEQSAAEKTALDGIRQERERLRQTTSQRLKLWTILLQQSYYAYGSRIEWTGSLFFNSYILNS
jgi:hypothetical protein